MCIYWTSTMNKRSVCDIQDLLFFASFLICTIVGNLCVSAGLLDQLCVTLNCVLTCTPS